MPNRNKEKGDRFESATLLSAKALFPDAFRTRAGWDDDRGDVVLDKQYRFIIQSKDSDSKPWYAWLDKFDNQLVNAGAMSGAIVVKRRGVADAGQAMAYMRYSEYLKTIYTLSRLLDRG